MAIVEGGRLFTERGAETAQTVWLISADCLFACHNERRSGEGAQSSGPMLLPTGAFCLRSPNEEVCLLLRWPSVFGSAMIDCLRYWSIAVMVGEFRGVCVQVS